MWKSSFRRHCGGWVAGVAALLVAVEGAKAQDAWKATSNSWFTAANWTAGVPTSAVDAVINNGGTAQISQAGAAAANLTLGLTAGTSGGLVVGFLGTASLTVTTVLAVGNSGSGTMSIPAGSVVDAVGTIGTTGFGP